MKILIIFTIMILAVWGVVDHYFPQIGASLPVLGAISTALDDSGVSAAPGKLVSAGRDLGDAARAHHFGGWHIAVIVLAVLAGRKLAMWLLR
ncbi:MAG: hypothetical protein HZB43_09780 [candidate division Zixibacteria bacterium]|nr:hypothetical protein [candidate division Zixibacteria bacterium]